MPALTDYMNAWGFTSFVTVFQSYNIQKSLAGCHILCLVLRGRIHAAMVLLPQQNHAKDTRLDTSLSHIMLSCWLPSDVLMMFWSNVTRMCSYIFCWSITVTYMNNEKAFHPQVLQIYLFEDLNRWPLSFLSPFRLGVNYIAHRNLFVFSFCMAQIFGFLPSC